MQGCRVLDLGIITAGAATSAVLADLGAEVIKIESSSYPDPFRKWTGEVMPGDHPDLPPFFRATNRGKRNIAIDLKHSAGRDVFFRLLAESDVVVENFSRGVLARLGLDYPTLKAVNSRIILASISSQGEDGPDARYVSFGSTLEAMAGLASITGYAGSGPVVSGIEMNYPDQVVAIFAAGMIATAWFDRGAGGTHLDLSQRELTSFLCGEAFLRPEAASEPAGRCGNAQAGIPVQDCFRAQDGRWVAVTVLPDAMQALETIAPPGRANGLAAWIAQRSAEVAVAALGKVGIAAAIALDGMCVLAERGTGWSRALRRHSNGDLVKGPLFDDAAFSSGLDPAAGLVGADTRDILGRVGGYGPEAIEALIASGAVAAADTVARAA